MSDLRILERAGWPQADDDPQAGPPKLAGFVVSSFSPLAAEAAERCLRRYHGEPPAPAEHGRTAVVVVSRLGDFTTDRAVAAAVDADKPVQPLLFFQSVPNAVIGHVGKRWQLRGPVVCFSPEGDPETEALDYAELLIADGDADRALLILVDLAVTEGAHGTATALLVGPAGVLAREEDNR